MNISAIQANNLSQSHKYNNNVAFGNGFKNPLSAKAISTLGQNIIEVVECSQLNEVNKYIPFMLQRQKIYYPQSKSLEMFKIKDADLVKFLESRVKAPHNLYYYEGIGIAIGDGGKSIESWNKAYETLVCLVPKIDAASQEYKVFVEKLARGVLS